MLSGRLLTWLAWAALGLYVLIGLAPGHGLVICIGPDGHVAVEIASADWNCVDCVAESSAEETCCSSSSDPDAGCRCADIPLIATDARRATLGVQTELLVIPPVELAPGHPLATISERIIALVLEPLVARDAHANPVLRI